MKIKELIEAVKNECGSAFQNCNDCEYGTHNGEVIEKLHRLAELEDKMEQGLLVELPCKVGDTMYQVFHPSQVEPFPFKVEKIRVIIQADEIKVYVEEIGGKGGTVGIMAFTREEAEKKLEELKNERDFI